MEKAQPKPKIVVIVGPTASGKSSLAVALAKKYHGEIISADSRQIYKKLDIGTAKITEAEMEGVPHHLIDIIDIEQSYSAEQFKKDASLLVEEIAERGNMPIVVGGTFFYVDLLLGKIGTPKVPPDAALREELEKLSAPALYERLKTQDEKRAETIDHHNKRRLVRALEVVAALGHVPTIEVRQSPYDALILGIAIDKEGLREKFRTRAQEWLKNGFLTEIGHLLDSEVKSERLSEIGFEYQLGQELYEKKISEEVFIERFVQKNWQYAKRQLTWLKRDKSIVWVYPAEKTEVHLLVENFLRN